MSEVVLSIIIVNYNTQKLLKQCIESIKKSIKAGGRGLKKVEIIVVDNASTDGSREYLEKLHRINKTNNKLQTPDPSHFFIKVVFNKKNLGFAKANNQGIKIAKGKYILLLNSDTIVEKGAVEGLVKFAEKNPDVGVVGPRLLNPDGSLQPSCFRFPSIWGAIKEFWLGKEGSFTKWVPKGNKPVVVDAVVGAAFLITPLSRKRVGLLDERYFFYFEDLDYCRRVWRAGLKVYYLPKARIVHLHGASGKELGDKPNRWLIESSKIYYGTFYYRLLTAVIKVGNKFFAKKKSW